MDDNNSLKHVGILGMHWGQRRSHSGPNGEKMTSVRGKRVPKMTSVRGKPVQVYNRNPKLHGSVDIKKTLSSSKDLLKTKYSNLSPNQKKGLKIVAGLSILTALYWPTGKNRGFYIDAKFKDVIAKELHA
jgi:hypothetical protein